MTGLWRRLRGCAMCLQMQDVLEAGRAGKPQHVTTGQGHGTNGRFWGAQHRKTPFWLGSRDDTGSGETGVNCAGSGPGEGSAMSRDGRRVPLGQRAW